MKQLDMFEELFPNRKRITKPIKLIELFAGYGSQNLALKYFGANFESHRIAEWAVKSIQAYKDLHCPEDHTNYALDLTQEELTNFLYRKGISMDYSAPMTREQIARLGIEREREIYNNIVATKNLVSVCNIHAQDLNIKNKDKYEYIMTYSFPCQDLSLAGKTQGMKKGSGTRSGLLWEVERILNELKARNELPQILLMENVTQVHGKKNWADFEAWKKALTQLGYCNFWKDLIATDYGVPQTRDRTFMVSILGDYNYNFPKPVKLEKRLLDLLEDDVPEKYFLSDKMLDYIVSKDDKYKVSETNLKINRKVACSKTTREGWTRADTSDYICDQLEENTNLLKIKNATKKGYLLAEEGDGVDIGGRMDDNFIQNKVLMETLEKNPIPNDTAFIDGYNRKIKTDGNAITITTRVDASNNNFLLVKNETLKRELCNMLIQEGKVQEGDVVKHSYTQQIMDGNKKAIETTDSMITLTTRGDCVGVCVKDSRLIGGFGTKGSTEQFRTQNRIYASNCSAPTINTGFNPNYAIGGGSMEDSKLRIRKLTPKECFKLMGVRDEDYDKIKKNQSDASLYHLAGDSIVVNVLMHILAELL